MRDLGESIKQQGSDLADAQCRSTRGDAAAVRGGGLDDLRPRRLPAMVVRGEGLAVNDPRVDNILATYAGATDDQRREGAEWYSATRTFCVGLAERYGVSVRQAAGVVAALSPRMPWDTNMRAAQLMLVTGKAPCLGASVRRAARIMAGEDPDVVFAAPAGNPLSGQKVRAFFACIVDPSGDAVCVDRHAFDVAAGRVTDERTRKALDRVGVYDAVADAYRAAGRILGLPAMVVQAITWVAWRAS